MARLDARLLAIRNGVQQKYGRPVRGVEIEECLDDRRITLHEQLGWRPVLGDAEVVGVRIAGK